MVSNHAYTPVIDHETGKWRIGLAVFREHGYIATKWLFDEEYDCQQMCDEFNKANNLTTRQVMMIVGTSMFPNCKWSFKDLLEAGVDK